MNLEIISPDQILYKGEATGVKMPGADGSFEILNNHAAIIARLKEGEVRINNGKNAPVKIHITGGIVEALKNNVIILT